LFLIAEVSFAQPANDNCGGAASLGTLAAPGACGSGIQNGTVTTLTTTNVGATPENPYIFLAGCGMAVPANDVWYSFVAPTNGFGVKIVISSAGFPNPNIALWDGSSCGNLAGVACTVGSGGTATLSVASGLIAGQTYFIQISGNTGQSGPFTLSVNAFQNCSTCLNSGNLTITPLPVNGRYKPGQTVQFCFHIDTWSQVGTNWLHGVQPSFGSGWNLATLTPTPPATYTATAGSWAYYPAGETSSVNGAWPAGFYFDANSNGNPGDNFGDGTSSPTVLNPPSNAWNFCWTVQVKSGCNTGLPLTVTVNTSGDGESGSWTNAGCSGDPAVTFSALVDTVLTIVNSPTICSGGSAVLTAGGAITYTWNTGATTNTISVNPASTTVYTVTGNTGGCNSVKTTTVTVNPTPTITVNTATICSGGSAFLTASGATTYSWNTGQTTNSINVSPPTTTFYTVTGTSPAGCSSVKTTTVTVNMPPIVNVNTATVCSGNSAVLTATGATTYSWNTGQTTNSISVSPPTTTFYTVTGTSFGCNAVKTTTVTVNPTPTVSVNSPTICGGGSATLTATGATTYSWSPATGLSATSGASVTANPAVTTNYTVTGTTASCTGTATSTVTVNVSPAVNAGPDQTICNGGSTTITASGATTYSWSPSAGLSGTTVASVTATPTVTTTYTVVGTTAGCSSSDNIMITVNAIPAVTVNSPTICVGQTAPLNASGASTYTWSPATSLSSASGSSVTFTGGSTSTITVSGTNSGGCTATVTTTVVVNPNPVASFTANNVCFGNPTTITNTTAGGPYIYNWDFGDASLSTVPNPSPHIYAAPGVYTITLVVTTTAGGCSNTSAHAVTVAAGPTVTVNSPSYCAGGSAVLAAGSAAVYSWSPSTGLSSTTTASVTASPSVTTIYTVTGTTSGCSSSATSTVTVNANPIISVNSATICSGNSATLNATGAGTYTWNPGTLTGPTQNVSPTSTTVYTVNGTSSGGCPGTATTTVIVNATPVVTVTVTPSTICAGGIATFTAAGASSYTWLPSGNITPTGSNTASANPPATTIYSVTGANGSCTAVKTVTLNVLAPLTATLSVTQPTCAGTFNGSASINVSGGSSSYAYSWAGGISSTTSSASGIGNGNYSVSVSDASCSSVITKTFSIVSPPALTITPSSTNVTCAGNGSITMVASGGVGPYQYALNAGSFSPVSVFSNLTAGNYTVTVADANSCSGSVLVIISQTVTVPIVSVNSDTVCKGDVVTLVAQGALTYSWAPVTGLSDSVGAIVTLTPNANVSYTVTGTSAGNCNGSAVSTIMVIDSFTVFSNGDTICKGSLLTVVPHHAFSPNGDGLNDLFIIDNISQYAKNHVYFFNRWGVNIWNKENYNNTTVVWDGKSNGLAVNPGTYFYIIEIDGRKQFKGWVEVTK
jgi:gliding motility-associated-like protein